MASKKKKKTRGKAKIQRGGMKRAAYALGHSESVLHAKRPKKPKLRKLPRAPKENAPATSWIRYKRLLELVKQRNEALLAPYRKALQRYELAKKKKQEIRAFAQRVKQMAEW